MGVKKEAKP